LRVRELVVNFFPRSLAFSFYILYHNVVKIERWVVRSYVKLITPYFLMISISILF